MVASGRCRVATVCWRPRALSIGSNEDRVKTAARRFLHPQRDGFVAGSPGSDCADLRATVDWYQRVLAMEPRERDGRWALHFPARAAAEGSRHAQKINLHQRGREMEPHAMQPTPGSGDLCFVTGRGVCHAASRRSGESRDGTEASYTVWACGIELGRVLERPSVGCDGRVWYCWRAFCLARSTACARRPPRDQGKPQLRASLRHRDRPRTLWRQRIPRSIPRRPSR